MKLNVRTKRTFGTKKSIVVKTCQICQNTNLQPILFLGFMPPVNLLPPIGTLPREQPSYPAQLLFCNQCTLVQLGVIVDPTILFPFSYPYTSSTTKILRDNFADLYREVSTIIPLKQTDLIIDIGSNDGNLLNNFRAHRVLGITPERIGRLAIKNGIPTIIDYFNRAVVKKVLKEYGKAKIITATNVFAHMEDIHNITDLITDLLTDDGIFISESHYLLPLVREIQFDTIYHEHLRYYSLHSLSYLLTMHGLEVFHAKQIPPHGGSIRVYAARKGTYPIQKSVKKILMKEKPEATSLKSLQDFSERVLLAKLKLLSLLYRIKKQRKSICGISAPSRATTLVNYTKIDESIVDCVYEVDGSHKIGKYVPGTLIPILAESRLFKNQPSYALILSWHIAKEIMPKLKQKGFQGDFIVPLPNPKIIKNKDLKY